MMEPVHPGEILREDFMTEYGLTAYSLAKAIHVPRDRIESLSRGRRAVTADTALRLARYFGNSPQFWLNLQSHYDLEVARSSVELEVIEPHPGQYS
ncbi:MAG: HigA family addiction module antidote protein [Proteobacteria bacterium]|nr:HigA family addiction module antidote protein [Pseudomonadota bacterium]